MGGGSKSQTVGYKYYLGMHMALCHGPIDYLLALLVDKKVAWGGQQATNGQLTVAAEGLFGGEDREGGVSGTLDYEMGGPTQPVNSYLAGKQGGDVPAYRGIVGLVLKKMYLGMNPYLKPWSAVAQRVFVRQDGVEQWYITKAAIANPSAQAVGYSPRFQEQFESISPYTVVSGNGALFGVSGGTMMIGTQNTGTVARIKRTIPSTTFSKLTMKVQLPLVGAATDDAAIIEFMNGDTVVFTVNPMREQAFDSQRRPRFYYNGSDNFMGSALTPATWYRFTWEMNQDTGAWSASFVRDSDGAVHATASGSGVTPATVDGIRFTVDSGGQTVTAQYREITMYSTGGVGVDMNPAHIIRECLTDPDWGMGYEEADIDDVAFRAAADTLYAEGMGMSLLWDRQIPIEDFIKEVLKHIDGTVYVSRSTGQFVLKLIRDDYDEGSLLVLNESNVVKVDNYSERRFDEMVNSVTVKYTDAATWNDAAVEVQDIAQVHMQNAVINTTVNYPGFMYAALASRAGARDLKTLSTPLATCTIYANLEAKDLNIGDAFKFTWPDYQVSNLVMRVTAISFGDGKDNTVKISCTQDSFATPSAEYVVTDPGEWTDPNGPPTPAEATKAFEIPYYELVRAVGQTAADNQITANGDLGYAGVAAAAPASGAINATMMSDAGAGFENVGTLDFCPSATIATGVGFLDTTVTLENGGDLDGVVAGSHAQIDDEHIVVVSLVGDVLTFKRGALDSVPAEHTTGARIFFWGSNDSLGYDPTEYNAGESVDIRVLPVTGQGQLALGDADTDTVVMDTRAARPYPPGNVKINGDYYPATVEDALVLTWAHRDRKQQTGGTLLDFTSASVGPENGTVYNARLVDPATDNVLAEQTGISGTTVTLDAAFAGIAHVELESVRDGLPSFQKHVIPVDFAGGDVILTEAEGALLLETSEAILIENLNIGAFGYIVQQEAADVRDGNRQVVYFRFSGSPTDAQFNPPKPQVFSYSCQKMQTPNPSQFFHTAQSTLSSVIGGGFSNQYSYVHERLCFLVSDAGVPQDKGISSAASAVGADVTAYKRNPTPGGPYPSDWCSNFDTNGGAEGAGYDYCIVFPVGEKVVWRWSPTQLSGAGAGDWEFMLYTTPDYPIAPTVRLDVKLGSGFLDKVTTARPQVTLVYYNGDVVERARYRVTLNGTTFSYTAQSGDTMADVRAGLAAIVNADTTYSATDAYAPYIQISGEPAVADTVVVEVLEPLPNQRCFFWYDPDTNTVTFADKQNDYFTMGSGLSRVGPLTRGAPEDKWLASIGREDLYGVDYQWWKGQSTNEARQYLTPQPSGVSGYFSGYNPSNDIPSAAAWDPDTNNLLLMSYNPAGSIVKERRIDDTGVVVSTTTVTVGGGSSYQFYPWTMIKFAGQWRSFSDNYGRAYYYKRNSSSTDWTEYNHSAWGVDILSGYGKYCVGAGTLSSGGVMIALVDHIYSNSSPQPHYMQIMRTTDGETWTQVGALRLLNTADGGTTYAGEVGWIMSAGGGYGSRLHRVGTGLAYYFGVGGAVGGTGPGTYVLKSNSDGTSWTVEKCTVDGSAYTGLLSNIVANEDGSCVLARIVVDPGLSTCACKLLKSTNGIDFSEVPNSVIRIPGFAEEAGADFREIPGSIIGDVRAPLLSSGKKFLFERLLRD